MDYINRLAALARSRSLPVYWTYVAFNEDGSDCGVFGSRDNTPYSLQNIKRNSPRAALDPRLAIAASDYVVNKLMPSGCVRATVVEGLSRGYRVIVPEECVADLHESPHFANLYDMHMKYADYYRGVSGT
jgi:maleamate amidohydrolase